MNRSTNRCRKLFVEALEDRRTPSVGTFVEDFTNDTFRSFGGYDTCRDGVQISHMANATGASFIINSFGSPGGVHSLRLKAVGIPEAWYLGWVYHTAEAGGLAPWEVVTRASITVRGGGTITFMGNDEITFTNTAPADQWVTFTVTNDMLGENGMALGGINQFRVATAGEMLVGDATVVVERDSSVLHPGDGEVRVAWLGSGLVVAGGARNDLVRVEFVHDDAGTVRVIGIAGTRVTSLTPGLAIQVNDSVVEAPNFAYVKSFDADGNPEQPSRNLVVNLRGGDDFLEMASVDAGGIGPERKIDDVSITTGGGESIVSLDGVRLYGSLFETAGPVQDTLIITGASRINGINVDTGAGDDTVQIGQPGRKLFDREPVDDITITGRDALTNGGPARTTAGIYTGPGRDTVQAAGFLVGFTVHLGAGADWLRFESAKAENLRVNPGLGADQVEFVESVMGRTLMVHETADVIRLHRVAHDAGATFFEFARPLGVRFELPASGTEIRHGATYQLDPNDPIDELREAVFGLGVPLLMALQCPIVFATMDF